MKVDAKEILFFDFNSRLLKEFDCFKLEILSEQLYNDIEKKLSKEQIKMLDNLLEAYDEYNSDRQDEFIDFFFNFLKNI